MKPSNDVNLWYRDYWPRMQARERLTSTQKVPVLHWFWSEQLNEVERLIFSRTSSCGAILDYGAGDGALKRKFMATGFAGRYETFDIAPGTDRTIPDPADIQMQFDAIFCLEVIEHMTLNDYVVLMDSFQTWLKPNGLLVISTPNPLCVTPMWNADAGHIQQYPLADLCADLSIRGFQTESFRVVLGNRPTRIHARARALVRKVLCYLLSVDYAPGLLVIAHKSA